MNAQSKFILMNALGFMQKYSIRNGMGITLYQQACYNYIHKMIIVFMDCCKWRGPAPKHTLWTFIACLIQHWGFKVFLYDSGQFCTFCTIMHCMLKGSQCAYIHITQTAILPLFRYIVFIWTSGVRCSSEIYIYIYIYII